jgi:stage II sporulation protein AA (anti-sigma F factor antagonist)
VNGGAVTALRRRPSLIAPARPALRLSITTDRDRVTVRAHGEIDLASAPTFRAVIDDCLRCGPRHVIVDLRATTFLDSAGMHVLLDAHRQARRLGLRLTVRDGAVTANARKLIDVQAQGIPAA